MAARGTDKIKFRLEDREVDYLGSLEESQAVILPSCPRMIVGGCRALGSIGQV